jgi:hypothetical protein
MKDKMTTDEMAQRSAEQAREIIRKSGERELARQAAAFEAFLAAEGLTPDAGTKALLLKAWEAGRHDRINHEG